MKSLPRTIAFCFSMLFAHEVLADVLACAPEIFATAVSSKPYNKKEPYKPKVQRLLWHADSLLVSVTQVAACEPAFPVEPNFSISQNTITVWWSWDTQFIKKNPGSRCLRQIDLILYVPKQEYKVVVSEKPKPANNCITQ